MVLFFRRKQRIWENDFHSVFDTRVLRKKKERRTPTFPARSGTWDSLTSADDDVLWRQPACDPDVVTCTLDLEPPLIIARELFNNDVTLSTVNFPHFRYFLSFVYFCSKFLVSDFRNWSLFDGKWHIVKMSAEEQIHRGAMRVSSELESYESMLILQGNRRRS